MKALIVDDESSARSRLTRQLRTCVQIEVVGEAENGLTALQAIVEGKPDVVFLDIQMPEMTGSEVPMFNSQHQHYPSGRIRTAVMAMAPGNSPKMYKSEQSLGQFISIVYLIEVRSAVMGKRR